MCEMCTTWTQSGYSHLYHRSRSVLPRFFFYTNLLWKYRYSASIEVKSGFLGARLCATIVSDSFLFPLYLYVIFCHWYYFFLKEWDVVQVVVVERSKASFFFLCSAQRLHARFEIAKDFPSFTLLFQFSHSLTHLFKSGKHLCCSSSAVLRLRGNYFLWVSFSIRIFNMRTHLIRFPVFFQQKNLKHYHVYAKNDSEIFHFV